MLRSATLTSWNYFFNPFYIRGSIDADATRPAGDDPYRDAVLERTQLLQRLPLLENAPLQSLEAQEKGAPVSVDADMFEKTPGAARKRRPREVERVAVLADALHQEKLARQGG